MHVRKSEKKCKDYQQNTTSIPYNPKSLRHDI